MIRLIVRPSAELDIRDAADWYEDNEDHSGCHASPVKAVGGEVGWLGALVGAVIAARARRRGEGSRVGGARRRLDNL
jgi:hypothetical protein